MSKQWVITAGLLLAIALIGFKMAQLALPKPSSPTISFTCAVAVNHQIGEVCIKATSGATVSVEIHYCDGGQISSPTLRKQIAGEYRWIWHVETACRGQASGTAMGRWPGGGQAEAIAIFEVA